MWEREELLHTSVVFHSSNIKSFETLCSLNVINSSQFDSKISCKNSKLSSIVQVIRYVWATKLQGVKLFVLDV